VRILKSSDLVTALRVATNQERLPEQWIDHLTETPEEAKELKVRRRQQEMLLERQNSSLSVMQMNALGNRYH